MLNSGSTYWNKYTGHLLKWEGKTSKDPRDTAASCAPFAGAYHTNKGITYCTFKSLAASLGISPVNYNRFLAITDAEAGRFAYRYYQEVDGENYPDSVALAMTEAAWGSGRARAFRHLQDALNDLGRAVPITSATNQQAIQAARSVNEQKLFDAYQSRRRAFLVNTLGSQPKYQMFVKGWTNRLNDFNAKFRPGGPTFNPVMIAMALLLRGTIF